MDEASKFKTNFKYFKQKCPPPDYSTVWDFSNPKEDTGLKRLQVAQCGTAAAVKCKEAFVASLMKPPSEWDMHELSDKPGLIFIRNPFTAIGQRYWIYRCLKDYSRKPSRLNIDAHNILEKSQGWWDLCQKEQADCKSLRKRLRWASMGYHHNWDTKVYSEDMRDPFPEDLADLSRFLGRVIGLQDDFSAEAAIVNFYHFDSTLSGHTDHSELNMSAPLFSVSFGQTAIFLLGGTTLDIAPTPMYIRSGDIVIMSEYSRKCYHGIPKIIAAQESPWSRQTIYDEKHESMNSDYNRKYDPSSKITERVTNDEKSYANSNISESVVDELIKNLSCEEFWKPFEIYIQTSRINMNVRQVLFKGEKTLSNKNI